MKFKYKILFIIIYIAFIFTLFIPINKVKAYDDIDYTFNDSNPYSDYSTIPTNHFNLKHNDNITGNYNASYSFTNQLNGSNPIGWEITEPNGFIDVIDNKDKHDKVVMIRDNGGAGNKMFQTTNSQVSGTIEYWQYSSDATDRGYFTLMNAGITYLCQVYNHNDIWYYNDGIPQHSGKACQDNTWYHIRIDWEAGAGGYLGLAPDTWNLYIDDFLIAGISFHTVSTDADFFRFETGSTDTDYNVYFDAIGHNWLSNYSIRDNIYPNITLIDNSILSNDRYEFSIDDTDLKPYTDGESAGFIDNWNQLGSAGRSTMDNDNFFNPSLPLSNLEDYAVELYPDNAGVGIYKDDLDLHFDMINITFGLRNVIATELNSYIQVIFYSKINTEIIDIRLDTLTATTAELEYFDGVVYQSLETLIDIDDNYYEFNVYLLDYDVYLILYINGIYENSYTFPFQTDKSGLNQINIIATDNVVDGNYFKENIHYCGIYQYNISIHSDTGYLSYDIGNTWNGDLYNLFQVDTTDTLRIITTETYQWIEGLDYNIFGNIDNESYFNNLYGESFTQNYPNLLFLIYTYVDISTISFSVSGIEMKEGSNTYLPFYNSFNVNINYSYFYVLNSKLYHILDITQNNVAEFIQINFNISYVLSINRSFTCKNIFNTIGIGNMRVNYTDDTFNSYEYTGYSSTINNILPQDKIIRGFTFVISDINENGLTGFVSLGNIYNLKLKYFLDITLTISTIALLTAMIPILVLIVPTLALRTKFGKSVIIPMLIFMSLICLIGLLIPVWLFFIIILAFGSFFAFQRNEGGFEL